MADFQRDSGSEWVIIAVLDKKSPVKLTKKGDRYANLQPLTEGAVVRCNAG